MALSFLYEAVTAVALLVLRGWVVSIFWNSFLVPMGPSEISLVQSVGVVLLAQLLTHQQPSEDSRSWLDRVLYSVFFSLFALVGALVLIQLLP